MQLDFVLTGQILFTVVATLGLALFVTRFTLPSDASTQVEVHVRAYNLYTARPSGRTA